MYTVRIHSQLEDRLDAEFYNPEALKTVQRIDGLGKTKRLGQLIADGYRVVYHGTDSINGIPEERLLPFLSPTQIDDQGSIDFSAADKLPLYYKDDYPKGLALAGELLIEVKGNVSKVGVVPEEFPKHLMVSGSLYKASFKSDTNSRYVLAFLKSKHGQILKNRLTSNTIINYIAKDALYSIPLFAANSEVQKYIGDKVRQAERLRAWAKECECKINAYLDSVFPKLIFGGHFQRVPLQVIGSRLDAEYYKEEQLGLEEFFSSGDVKVKTLSQLSKDSFSGAAIPSDAFGSVGVPVLQTKDINEKGIDLEGCVRVSEEIAKNFAKFSASYGSIIMGMSGTVGRSSLLYKEGSDFIINQRVSAIKILDANLMGYVCFYLNHKFGKMQMTRRSVGGVQANISLGDILTVKVVIPKDEVLSDLNTKAVNVFTAIEESKKLTSAAKLLVEALIEGQLTEAELIAAEQAQQAGNDQLDRRILNRLKSDGIDGQGPALFADLDELYHLLTQAEGD